MFGIAAKSKSFASLVSAGALASALLAPAAIAGPLAGGNAFEIPPLSNSRAYYSSPQDSQEMRGPAIEQPILQHRRAQALDHTATNSKCPGGYTWSESMAGNGMSIPMPCRG